jgi:hypothetical protein
MTPTTWSEIIRFGSFMIMMITMILTIHNDLEKRMDVIEKTIREVEVRLSETINRRMILEKRVEQVETHCEGVFSQCCDGARK